MKHYIVKRPMKGSRAVVVSAGMGMPSSSNVTLWEFLASEGAFRWGASYLLRWRHA